MSKTDSILIVAIDFGTTYSGYAFQFRHDYESDRIGSIFANTSWTAQSGNGLTSWKTPTTLLLNPDSTFNSFGYDAEEEYQELIENEEHHDFHYFRRFKMMLHNKVVKQNYCSSTYITWNFLRKIYFLEFQAAKFGKLLK